MNTASSLLKAQSVWHVQAWMTPNAVWIEGIKYWHNGDSVMVRLSSSLYEISNMLPLLGLDLKKEQFTVSSCNDAHIFTHNALCDVFVSASSSKMSQARGNITPFVLSKHSQRGPAWHGQTVPAGPLGAAGKNQCLTWTLYSVVFLVHRVKSSVACH